VYTVSWVFWATALPLATSAAASATDDNQRNPVVNFIVAAPLLMKLDLGCGGFLPFPAKR
jgi:hypothetical protein